MLNKDTELEQKRKKEHEAMARMAKRLLENSEAAIAQMREFQKANGSPEEQQVHPSDFCHYYLANWAKAQLQ